MDGCANSCVAKIKIGGDEKVYEFEERGLRYSPSIGMQGYIPTVGIDVDSYEPASKQKVGVGLSIGIRSSATFVPSVSIGEFSSYVYISKNGLEHLSIGAYGLGIDPFMPAFRVGLWNITSGGISLPSPVAILVYSAMLLFYNLITEYNLEKAFYKLIKSLSEGLNPAYILVRLYHLLKYLLTEADPQKGEEIKTLSRYIEITREIERAIDEGEDTGALLLKLRDLVASNRDPFVTAVLTDLFDTVALAPGSPGRRSEVEERLKKAVEGVRSFNATYKEWLERGSGDGRICAPTEEEVSRYLRDILYLSMKLKFAVERSERGGKIVYKMKESASFLMDLETALSCMEGLGTFVDSLDYPASGIRGYLIDELRSLEDTTRGDALISNLDGVLEAFSKREFIHMYIGSLVESLGSYTRRLNYLEWKIRKELCGRPEMDGLLARLCRLREMDNTIVGKVLKGLKTSISPDLEPLYKGLLKIVLLRSSLERKREEDIHECLREGLLLYYRKEMIGRGYSGRFASPEGREYIFLSKAIDETLFREELLGHYVSLVRGEGGWLKERRRSLDTSLKRLRGLKERLSDIASRFSERTSPADEAAVEARLRELQEVVVKLNEAIRRLSEIKRLERMDFSGLDTSQKLGLLAKTETEVRQLIGDAFQSVLDTISKGSVGVEGKDGMELEDALFDLKREVIHFSSETSQFIDALTSSKALEIWLGEDAPFQRKIKNALHTGVI